METPIRPLIELAHGFRVSLPIKDMLQRMVNTAAVVLGVSRASVRLLDESGTTLVAICRAGTPVHANPETAFKVGEGLVGWVAEHLQPLRTEDAEADERFVQKDGQQSKIGSFLGAPMVSGGRCMGVLSAVAQQPGYFTRAHEELAILIVAICEPHIERARRDLGD
jgi:GAF domain-containing protein